jgi:hypothetical protein
MSSDRYAIIDKIDGLISNNETVPRCLFETLRANAVDTEFLEKFDIIQVKKIISRIFLNLENLQDQLDVIRTVANILLVNENLRNTDDEEFISIVNASVPKWTEMLNQVSERRFNSESEYKDFLPIFRLFFLLTHNSIIIPNLKPSVVKISNKLLNFVTISSAESFNLNTIIIEILKIMYSFVHQVEITTGIDSPFVLSFNKFQLLYAKSIPSGPYDEILQHFGNVLMAIDPEISTSYMLNTLKFSQNQVSLINRLIEFPNAASNLGVLTSSLLTLRVAINIDSENSGVKSYIKENLNIPKLDTLPLSDPNYPFVLNQLKGQLSDTTKDFEKSQQKVSSPLAEFDRVLQDTVGTSKYVSESNRDDGNGSVPRFEDLSPEEQENELDKINEIFEKIEKNGMFKLQMK